MSHRAAVYSVKVHERGKPTEPRLLGEMTEHGGAFLGEFLAEVLQPGFSQTTADGEKAVTCDSSSLDGDDLQAVFRHGSTGLAANIVDGDGNHRIHQDPADTALVKCASLFRLPRNQRLGWWVVHINDNRGSKQLIHTEVLRLFRERFGEDLMLKISPSVSSAALNEAIDEGRLDSVKLVKYDRASDVAESERWVAAGTHAKYELRVSPIERGKRLVTGLVKRALDNDTDAKGQIVEFQGMSFDTAKLLVTMEDGAKRTFNIETPESGHAFTADIEPATADDGEPEDASIFSELERVLADME